MAFGDYLKLNLNQLKSSETKKSSKYSFWYLVKGFAHTDIINILPNSVDSDIAIAIYYSILKENEAFIPKHFKEKLKSNKQERYRVIVRNIFSSNAFHREGLGNMPGIEAKKELNLYKKGYKIVFRGKN
jgi:hypothetical protein